MTSKELLDKIAGLLTEYEDTTDEIISCAVRFLPHRIEHSWNGEKFLESRDIAEHALSEE